MHVMMVLVAAASVALVLCQDDVPEAPLQDSLVAWSKRLRECHGDADCYKAADDILRPSVRRAVLTEELPEILPCLDGWGVYDAPTEGREWNVKANLPC